MRLGCGGCLTTVVVFGVMAGAVASAVWVVTGVLADPNLPAVAAGDEARAAQKLVQIARAGPVRVRKAPEIVSLSEEDLNALLARRLAELAELPVSRVHLRLSGGGRAEIAGQVPFTAILSERPAQWLAGLLPASWQRTPIWVRLRLQARIEAKDEGRRRYLRLDIERFWLGQRRLPSQLPRLLLSPTTLRLLQLRLPDTVRDLAIDVGRVDVTTVASP